MGISLTGLRSRHAKNTTARAPPSLLVYHRFVHEIKSGGVMKAVILQGPGQAALTTVAEHNFVREDDVLLAVQMVGLCGSDLNSYRGRNPMVTFPRIPGHEIAATVAALNPKYPEWQPGTAVTVSPYTSCSRCAACLRGRPNACEFNQTLGVQRDGALTEFISVPAIRLHTGNLTLKELCMVEPLTVGFHAAARG